MSDNKLQCTDQDIFNVLSLGKKLTRHQLAAITSKQVIPQVQLQGQKNGKSKISKKLKQKQQSQEDVDEKVDDSPRDEEPQVSKHVKVIQESKLNLNQQKCILCNLILSIHAYVQCKVCDQTVHLHCLYTNKSVDQLDSWICEECQPCKICQKLQPKDKIMLCIKCHQRFHGECGIQEVQENEIGLYCPQCVVCTWCKKNLLTLRYKVVDNELLCEKCVVIKQSKQYCLECKAIWTQKEDDWEGDYIQCDTETCQMWIHKDCDKIFSDDPSLFENYTTDEVILYRCPKCRDTIKQQLIEDSIRFLSYFDVERVLWVVETSNNKYLEIIKRPMDFVTLYQKNDKKIYQSSQSPYMNLVADLRLLIRNCLRYNHPNSKVHRRVLQINAIYEIMYPLLKPLIEVEDRIIIQYQEEYHGLIYYIPQLLSDLGKWYLDEAFKGPQSNQQVIIVGQDNWAGSWESQLYTFSTSNMQKATFKSKLREFEMRINTRLFFENEQEPLIKLNLKDFVQHLLQQEITVKVSGIKGVISRSKVVAHPYIQQLLDFKEVQFKPPQRVDQNIVSSSIQEPTPMSYEFQKSSPQIDYNLENELQIFFNKLLNKDLSKQRYHQQQPTPTVTSQRLMTEFTCSTCGGYEFRDNFLFCSNCGEAQHFYCQIQNAHKVPKRVLEALASHINKQWKCNKCVECQICQRNSVKPYDLFCSLCNSFYHFKCVFDQFLNVSEPLDFWTCPQCFKCQICETPVMLENKYLQLIKSGSQCQGQISVSIDYFHNFIYCLVCGLGETGKRFCPICNKYIPMDPEKEILFTYSAKHSYNLFLQPIYWEYSGNKDNVFTQYFDNINLCGKSDELFIFLANQQRRNGLNYICSNNVEKSLRCKRCLVYFHENCLKSEGKQFNEKQYCFDCRIDYSEVLFKSERCKQEFIRLQYIDKKLKDLQPFLVVFLEMHAKQQQWNKKKYSQQLYNPPSTFQWPVLTDIQQNVLIQNIDYFDNQISAFIHSYNTLEKIKEDVFQQPNLSVTFHFFQQNIQEDQLDRIILYWSLLFGSVEYNSSQQRDQYKPMLSYLKPENHFYEIQLERQLYQIGQLNETLSLQYLINTYPYFTKCFKISFSQSHYRSLTVISELQCNLANHIIYEDKYYFVDDQYYLDYCDILQNAQVKLTNSQYNLQPKEKLIRQIQLNHYDQVLDDPGILIGLRSQGLRIKQIRGEKTHPLYYLIKDLQQRYNDTQINSIFQQVIQYTRGINVSILEMMQLYDESIDKYSNTNQEIEKQTSLANQRLSLYEQAKDSLDKVNIMISKAEQQVQLDQAFKTPLYEMQCSLCGTYSDRTLSGRLLYVDGFQWVHTNCALWSDDIKENFSEGQLVGVFQLLKSQAQSKCDGCGNNQATISCLSSNCRKRYHFYCAYSAESIFLSSKKVICKSCMSDIQAFTVDQLNLSSERSKNGILRNLLNEVVNSQYVDDFTTLRKLQLQNYTKYDKITKWNSNLLRFGNTILLSIQRSPQLRHSFCNLRTLVNQIGLQGQVIHKFIEVSFAEGTYKVIYNGFNQQQWQALLDKQMLQEEEEDRTQQQNQNKQTIFQDRFIQRIFDTGEVFFPKTLSQLKAILQDKQYFPLSLGDFTNQEDYIGHLFLLYTTFVKAKLGEKIILQEDQQLKRVEKYTNYYQWFYQDGIVESLTIQARVQQLQSVYREVSEKQEIKIEKQRKHPALLDLQPQRQGMHEITKNSGTTLSDGVQKEKLLNDNYSIQGQVLPYDIFLDAEIEVENIQNTINEKKQKEVDKRLKAEYQLIEQQKKKPCLLYVAPSRIHKYGLFTKQNIKQNDLVIEYTGEIISNLLSDQREAKYQENGFGDCYMFRVTKDKIIDATFKGSQARYLNHSCDPNCSSTVLDCNDFPKILIFAKCDIQANDELTYDYQFEVDGENIQCYCGSKNCFGRLN